ncbi:hypothetical protein O5D80_006783 [Batrachochytrium dendrobatidis]|nr:hypothetical protein O5D80_006783 [Batrachochytrium dendrobatidis]
MPVEEQQHSEGNVLIKSYRLFNDDETLSAQFIEYGATLTHFLVTASDGTVRDIVLGFDHPFEYMRVGHAQNPYFGCIIGRACNRTAFGKFHLNDQDYLLDNNNGPNHLHGGINGFDKCMWKGSILSHHPPSISFTFKSQNNDQNYPGSLNITITYTLQATDLVVQIEAIMDTDQPDSLQTYVNLTTHPYFNLDGMVNPTVLDHTIDMAGVKGVLELDDTQIPTGKVLDCTDFADRDIGFAQIHTKPDYFLPITHPQTIANGLECIVRFGGVDHFYLKSHSTKTKSDHELDSKLKHCDLGPPVMRLASHASGIALEMYTDALGIQVYTSNWLDGSLSAKKSSQPSNVQYGRFSAVCFEPSAPPNSINNPAYRHLVVMDKHNPWTQTSIYRVMLI